MSESSTTLEVRKMPLFKGREQTISDEYLYSNRPGHTGEIGIWFWMPLLQWNTSTWFNVPGAVRYIINPYPLGIGGTATWFFRSVTDFPKKFPSVWHEDKVKLCQEALEYYGTKFGEYNA